ncbi:oxidoreductase [Bacillus sp. CGMCC 1.16607]|uniref:oxidoreductase n=1 Tax=Bacillus sp. CGMCC 1.16607 TaxID=3351842 RepID=UPI00363E1BDA
MVSIELKGKNIIITGANSGLGLESAKSLSKQGATVILAVRNLQKGNEALQAIKETNQNASLEVMKLDLSDLKSVRDFADAYINKYNSLDILINNAGVMFPPYQKTVDGFELQFGSNHLGHFALTGLLLPVIKNTSGSRVVTLSSIAHRGASIYFNNLDGSKRYKAIKFYGQSKLANLLFSKELDQRLKQNGIHTLSIACHPGISATNLVKIGNQTPRYLTSLMKILFQPAEKGALPSIFAATEDSLKGGEYIGPNGLGNIKGYPAIEQVKKGVYDEQLMKKLWETSEKLTGVTFDFS